MFANCSLAGQDMGMPDVCKTPAPPSPSPIPVPYPNIAQLLMALPPTTCFKVLISFMPTHNLMTTIPMSNGDEPGVLGGIVSNTIMGPARNIMGSTKVLYGGLPATRMLDPAMQNLINVPSGRTLVPSQFKVMIMS
ncbi:MAG: DUF4150 domain-containing protein [Desulfobacula sp.]